MRLDIKKNSHSALEWGFWIGYGIDLPNSRKEWYEWYEKISQSVHYFSVY